MAILYDPKTKATVHDDQLPSPLVNVDDNGLYLVKRENGKSTYEKLDVTQVVPEYPESDGAYVLTVTMDDGEATLSWEAASE